MFILYKEFLFQNNKEYLRNIKSINYKRTENESLLDDFLSKNTYSQFNIFILGHSCGFSDEHILNKILGNEKVVNIIPLYYKDYDHYNEVFIIISQILKDEKKANKITPFNRCPMMMQNLENEETTAEYKNRINALQENIVFKE